MAPAMEAVFNNKDLLKSIFEQLDLHEICIAATTCQLWNQVRGVRVSAVVVCVQCTCCGAANRQCWQLHLHLLLCVLCPCQVANHDDFWKQIDFRGKQVLPINVSCNFWPFPAASAAAGNMQGVAHAAF